MHECSCKHLMMVLGPKHAVQRQRRKCCVLDGIWGNPIWFDLISMQRAQATKIHIYIKSISLSVPRRKHIIFQLQGQQVNAIYSFVTAVYQYNYHNSGHYAPSCLLFKTRRFRDRILSLDTTLFYLSFFYNHFFFPLFVECSFLNIIPLFLLLRFVSCLAPKALEVNVLFS
jgi:hypothetical protein